MFRQNFMHRIIWFGLFRHFRPNEIKYCNYNYRIKKKQNGAQKIRKCIRAKNFEDGISEGAENILHYINSI